jgi:hypothetical protein
MEEYKILLSEQESDWWIHTIIELNQRTLLEHYYNEWCEHRYFYNRIDSNNWYEKYFQDMNQFKDDINDLLNESILQFNKE